MKISDEIKNDFEKYKECDFSLYLPKISALEDEIEELKKCLNCEFWKCTNTQNIKKCKKYQNYETLHV